MIKSQVQDLRFSYSCLIYYYRWARIFLRSRQNCSQRAQNCLLNFYECSERIFIFYCYSKEKDSDRIYVARFQYYLTRYVRYSYFRISYFYSIFFISAFPLETIRWISGSMPLRVFSVIYCFFCFYHLSLLYC